jgi:hypothetical protein
VEYFLKLLPLLFKQRWALDTREQKDPKSIPCEKGMNLSERLYKNQFLTKSIQFKKIVQGSETIEFKFNAF